MRRVLAVLALTAVAAACASAPSLPPKASPDEVQVFYPNSGTEPDAGYKTIGPIKVERPLAESDAQVVAALRAAAAEMGADAILVRRISRTTEGAAGSGRDEMKIGEALAIYWPATQ